MYAIAVYGGVVLFSALLLYQTQVPMRRLLTAECQYSVYHIIRIFYIWEIIIIIGFLKLEQQSRTYYYMSKFGFCGPETLRH